MKNKKTQTKASPKKTNLPQVLSQPEWQVARDKIFVKEKGWPQTLPKNGGAAVTESDLMPVTRQGSLLNTSVP
jgi:hypothetical protein